MDHKKLHKLVFARNRKTQMIVQNAAAHQDQVEKNAETLALRNAARPAEAADEEPVWSARTQMIRDKNTGRKKAARSKWNRFAGTAGAGGMGR